MGTMATMDNHTRGDLARPQGLIDVVDPLLVVRERVGIDLNLPAGSLRTQVDKGAVILDVPRPIGVILGQKTVEGLLPIVIVVEKVPVDTDTIVKQSGHGHVGEVRERRQIGLGHGHECGTASAEAWRWTSAAMS